MPTPLKRILKITSIIILSVAVICIAGSYILTAKYEGTITQKLNEAGLDVKSVSISVLNRSVELESVSLALPDTLKNPHQLFIQKIRVSGIHIYSLLKKKEIIVGHLIIQNGEIFYNKNFTIRNDSSENPPKFEMKGLRVKHLAITSIHTALLNDTTKELEADIRDLELGEFKMSLTRDTSYSIEWIEAEIDNFRQSKKGSLHTFAAKTLIYNSREEHLEVDSFQVVPKYTKSDFARIAKIQKTRLDVLLPKIIFDGIKHNRLISQSTLEVSKIRIPKPIVHAYRDKRYPFVRDWIMPMPIEGIRRLPFTLDIDSILIDRADIAYEEFSEKGLPVTGTITFNKLDASFAGLNTAIRQPDKKTFCTLVADCKVMDNGVLHATFKLPLSATVNYEAYGNVRNMNLKSLNPALGNLTRVEISDGTLNDLRFNFSYNDDVSTGEVLINYKDLKLQALKKEKRNHETNKLLTAAINAIIKSDKDKSVDKSKRTGVIDIERDKKRFVFQFWWKSLLDGLQSTFTDNGKKKKTQNGSSR